MTLALVPGQAERYSTFLLGGEHYAVPEAVCARSRGRRPSPTWPLHPASCAAPSASVARPVPVVDLGARLGQAFRSTAARTVVFVVEVQRDGQPMLLGLTADTVGARVHLGERDVVAAPSFGATSPMDSFIAGMGRHGTGSCCCWTWTASWLRSGAARGRGVRRLRGAARKLARERAGRLHSAAEPVRALLVEAGGPSRLTPRLTLPPFSRGEVSPGRRVFHAPCCFRLPDCRPRPHAGEGAPLAPVHRRHPHQGTPWPTPPKDEGYDGCRASHGSPQCSVLTCPLLAPAKPADPMAGPRSTRLGRSSSPPRPVAPR